MPKFECIYFLENADLYMLEVKRKDCPENAPVSDIFSWLRIDKQLLTISSLTFRMMDASDQVEERYFDEGFLKFNETEGTYIEKYNAAQHPLTRRKDFTLPTVLTNAIETFLMSPS